MSSFTFHNKSEVDVTIRQRDSKGNVVDVKVDRADAGHTVSKSIDVIPDSTIAYIFGTSKKPVYLLDRAGATVNRNDKDKEAGHPGPNEP